MTVQATVWVRTQNHVGLGLEEFMDGLMAEAAAVGDEDVALDNSIQQNHVGSEDRPGPKMVMPWIMPDVTARCRLNRTWPRIRIETAGAALNGPADVGG